jgi:uncharacterized membrane protein
MLRSRAAASRMEVLLTMTAIDPRGEMEIKTDGDHVTARLPLREHVTDEWARRYGSLAQLIDVPARVHVDGGRAWIIIRMPISDPRLVAPAMNAARDLVAEADAATGAQSARSAAEAGVRAWWANTRAESRWPVVGALAIAIVVQLTLPSRFSLGQAWIVPAILGLLFATLLVVDHVRFGRRAGAARALTLAIAVVLVADGAGVTVRLITDLIQGGPETNSPSDLLSVGFGVWIYTVIAFAFLYWVLDGGGATARAIAPEAVPDLAFPQHLNPDVCSPGWRPRFPDYLYLGFTNATAFSPTDVMPLARWAKLAMTVQAFGSLALLGLVIARAVNILK